VKLRFVPEAAEELQHAIDWYDSQRVGLGFAFVESVDQSLELLNRFPDADVKVEKLATEVEFRRFPVQRFPFQVV
jgi:hypothetical protein